jgi:hypothetical protein
VVEPDGLAPAELLGGPADSRTVMVAMADGQPPRWVAVHVEPRYDSALDDEPAVPAELHRYRLGGTEPLRYLWVQGIPLTI